MDKNAILNSLTLLAQAYAFAKDGNEGMAGKLLVEAAADDNLDDVMDGVAQGAEELSNSDEDDWEEIPNEDGENSEETQTTTETETTEEITAHVELPESVARLAARTLV